jgi:hypothetical protein
MQLNDHPAGNYLVGCYDEVVDVIRAIGMREGYLRKDKINSTSLFHYPPGGTIQGEGAAFFSLSQTKGKNCWCRVADLQLMYRPTEVEIADALQLFLARNNIRASQLDAWINGVSGNPEGDVILETLGQRFLDSVSQVRFKLLCGEYCTAVSFGLWLGARILREQVVPESVRMVPERLPDKLNRIVITNHYLNRNYSFVLLER